MSEDRKLDIQIHRFWTYGSRQSAKPYTCTNNSEAHITTIISQKSLFKCHFVHHKPHNDRPGIEPEAPRWKASLSYTMANKKLHNTPVVAALKVTVCFAVILQLVCGSIRSCPLDIRGNRSVEVGTICSCKTNKLFCCEEEPHSVQQHAQFHFWPCKRSLFVLI